MKNQENINLHRKTQCVLTHANDTSIGITWKKSFNETITEFMQQVRATALEKNER